MPPYDTKVPEIAYRILKNLYSYLWNKACSRCESNYPTADKQNILNDVLCYTKAQEAAERYFHTDFTILEIM